MQKLREFCLHHHLAALWDVPMADYTTFKIGGVTDALLFPDTEAQLVLLLMHLAETGVPFRVIGNASNLLVADEGFHGAIVTTRHVRSVSVSGVTARASCGTPINVLCRSLADFSLGGLENIYGIPGTVGGAVFMNAGAFGAAISDHLSFVSVFDMQNQKTEVIKKEQCNFSYRNSYFRKRSHLVVLSADFSLSPSPCSEIREKMRTVLQERMERHPTALPSAGSTFLKPRNGYAWEWIERAGLSGARVGGAAVSVKHAGFIVNLGGATAQDVLDLIDFIVDNVKQKLDMELIPEIEYIHN